MSNNSLPSKEQLTCVHGRGLSIESRYLVELMRQTLKDCRSWMCDPAGMTAEMVMDRARFSREMTRIERRQTELLQRITGLINSPAVVAAARPEAETPTVKESK